MIAHGVAGEDEPLPDQELDLSNELPTKSRSEEAPIERERCEDVQMRFGVDETGWMYVDLQAQVRRAAEFTVLCFASGLVAFAGAGVCNTADAPGWLTALVGVLAGVLAFYIGYRAIFVPVSPSRPSEKEK